MELLTLFILAMTVIPALNTLNIDGKLQKPETMSRSER
jgi:hypothetical protein